jgi:hypothetical protein
VASLQVHSQGTGLLVGTEGGFIYDLDLLALDLRAPGKSPGHARVIIGVEGPAGQGSHVLQRARR